MGNYIKKYSTKLIYDSLIKNNGLITYAARDVGCENHTISLRIKKSKVLQDLMKRIKEIILDTGENFIHEAIVNGDLETIKWYFKYHGRDRGYTEKQIIEMKIDVTKLSDEEIDYAVKTGKLPNTNFTPVNSH